MSLYFPDLDAPLAVLHQAIAQFASDTMFGLAASRAAASLRLSTPDSQNMLVKEYSVQYGNPFPGQSFGIAHHCVDLIYLFDAFHDFLAEADKKEARKEKGTYEANRDNAELADEMQRDWIEFITKGKIKRGNDEMIKVYGHDRVVREESLDAETWVRQIRRFEALGRDLEGARSVFAKMNTA
jgi:carboxylesterase type B